jgi:hypothetical protein
LPRLWATSTTGRSSASTASSSWAIQSPRRGHSQSCWRTRSSPCRASQRVCQWPSPESCQPGSRRMRGARRC